MTHRLCITVCLTILLLAAVIRSAPTLPPTEEKGTYLGALFGPVPEALYHQLPQLPRQQGILLTYVLPDSPAAAAGLLRHDILLTYDGQKVFDCQRLARLIHDDKPGRKLTLTYLRDGREAKVDVTLVSGPVLKLAEPRVNGQRAINKPDAPPSVSVNAIPLENGQMKVTIEYYPQGSDHLKTVTWQGNPADIENAARPLPERERQLALHALNRLHAPKPAAVEH